MLSAELRLENVTREEFMLKVIREWLIAGFNVDKLEEFFPDCKYIFDDYRRKVALYH